MSVARRASIECAASGATLGGGHARRWTSRLTPSVLGAGWRSDLDLVCLDADLVNRYAFLGRRADSLAAVEIEQATVPGAHHGPVVDLPLIVKAECSPRRRATSATLGRTLGLRCQRPRALIADPLRERLQIDEPGPMGRCDAREG
jgi:hypothetical protein